MLLLLTRYHKSTHSSILDALFCPSENDNVNNRGNGEMANLYPPPLEKQETDKQSLAERVAAILRDMFLSGELRPGHRLIETEIAEQLEVSRGPVRDALKMLQEEGIVHIE